MRKSNFEEDSQDLQHVYVLIDYMDSTQYILPVVSKAPFFSEPCLGTKNSGLM